MKDAQILRAMREPADYSELFRQRVGKIADRLSQVIGTPVTHDADMNYSSAQKIKLWLDAKGWAIAPDSPDAEYALIVLISSKGPYFAYAWLGRDRSQAGSHWRAHYGADLPEPLWSYAERITSELKGMGYRPISGPILNEVVEGFLTDMDQTPATVFQVLFTELL